MARAKPQPFKPFDYFDLKFADLNPLIPGMNNSSNQSTKKKKTPTISSYEKTMKEQSKAYSDSLRNVWYYGPDRRQVTQNQIKSINKSFKGQTIAGMTPKSLTIDFSTKQVKYKPETVKVQKFNYGSIPYHYDARKNYDKLTERVFNIPSREPKRTPTTPQMVQSTINSMRYPDKVIKSLSKITGVGTTKQTPMSNFDFASQFKAKLNNQPLAAVRQASASSDARLSKISTTRAKYETAQNKELVAQANSLLEAMGADYRYEAYSRRRRQGRYAAEIKKVYWGEPYSTSYSNFYKGRTRTFTNTKSKGDPYSATSFGIGPKGVIDFIESYHRKNQLVDQYINMNPKVKEKYQQELETAKQHRSQLSQKLSKLQQQEKQLEGNNVYYKNQVIQGRSLSYERDPAKREQIRKSWHANDAKLSEVKGKISELKRQLQSTSNPTKAKLDFFNEVESAGAEKKKRYSRIYDIDPSIPTYSYAFVPDETLKELEKQHGILLDAYTQASGGLSKFGSEQEELTENEKKLSNLTEKYEEATGLLASKQKERINQLKGASAQSIDALTQRQLEHVKNLRSKGLLTKKEYENAVKEIQTERQKSKTQTLSNLKAAEQKIAEGFIIPDDTDDNLADDAAQVQQSTKQQLEQLNQEFAENTKEIKKQKALEAFGGVTKPKLKPNTKAMFQPSLGTSRSSLGNTGNVRNPFLR